MKNVLFNIMDKINIGLIIIDSEQRIVLWNSWMEIFTMKTRLETINHKLPDICPKFKGSTYQKIIENVLINGQSRFCSGKIHRTFVSPAAALHEEDYCQNLIVEQLNIENKSYVLLQIEDVTKYSDNVNNLKTFIKYMEQEYEEIKESEQNSKHLALHDFLTGLPNRILLRERLEQAISFSKRNNEKVLVLFLDLNLFKNVNDTYGHNIGDILLKQVSERLKSNIREIDTLARIGGDEFVIVFTQIDNIDSLHFLSKKLIKCIEMPFFIENIIINISTSIGISICPNDGVDCEELLNKADKAMYIAKRSDVKKYELYK